MKLFVIILLIIVLSQNALANQMQFCSHTPQEFKCVKYIKNYDGDTITVQIPSVHPLLGNDISVRVLGIDTAEKNGQGPCEKETALAAQKVIQSMLREGKQVDLLRVGRDKYFRILAEVWVDGVSLGETLKAQKLAYAYNGGTKKAMDWCQFRSNKQAKP